MRKLFWGMRKVAIPMALVIFVVLAFVVLPASAAGKGTLSAFLVGYWDELGAEQDQGFQLRIINPTAQSLEAVVAVFDSEEVLFACGRTVLSSNDEVLLNGAKAIWQAPDGGGSAETIQGLYTAANLGNTRREGVIKLVSLKPPEETVVVELANDHEEENDNGGIRVKDGLLAWIVNLGKVGDVSFTSVIELHGLPNEFLRKGRRSDSELEKIAGEAACGDVMFAEDLGEEGDTEPPEETPPQQE